MPTAPDPVLAAAPPSNTPTAPGNATGSGAVSAPSAPVAIQAGGQPGAPTVPGNATGSGAVAAPAAPLAVAAVPTVAASDGSLSIGGQRLLYGATPVIFGDMVPTYLYNGRMRYANAAENTSLVWNGENWVLIAFVPPGNQAIWESSSDVVTPDLATDWISAGAPISGVPSVSLASLPAVPRDAAGSGAVAAPEAPYNVNGAYGDFVYYLDISGEIGPYAGGTTTVPRMFEDGSVNGLPRWRTNYPPGGGFVPTGWECVYNGGRWKIQKFGFVSGTDPTWWSELTSAEWPSDADWTNSAAELRYSAGTPVLVAESLQMTAPDSIQAGGQPSAPAVPGNATGSGSVSAPTAPVSIQAGGPPSAPTAPGNATGSGSVSAPTAPLSIQAGGQPSAPTVPGNATGTGSVSAPSIPEVIQAGGQPSAPTVPGNATGTGTVSAPTAPVSIQAGGPPSAPTVPGNAAGSGSVSAPTAPSPVQP